MTTHRSHTPDHTTDTGTDTGTGTGTDQAIETGADRRGGLIGYLRATGDWSKGEVYMVTGIAAGTTWLTFTHLLHAPTGVKAMLTCIVALLAFAQCRQRHLNRHTHTGHKPETGARSEGELADGLYEPGTGRTAAIDGEAPATVPDPRHQP